MFSHCANWYGNGYVGSWGGGFGMMIFWGILIVALIYFLFKNRNIAPNGIYSYPRDNSLDILKERYAKGEISDEEFENKKKILSKSK